jgi:hypothetical protein
MSLDTRRSRMFSALILMTLAGHAWAAGASPSLKVSSLFPANGTKDVCPDAQLKIDFAAPPKVGAGKIQVFDAADNALIESIDAAIPTQSQSIGGQQPNVYYPITISGNQAAIHLKNHALAYGKTYYVTLDPGVFTDAGGDSAPLAGKDAWQFSTRAQPPKAGTSKLTVAADGTGDFCTVQGALDFIPDGNTVPTTLFLRKGTYTEMIFLRNKNRITILGEDRKQSVIAYANNARFNSRRSVMQINNCNDFVMANLTVWNTTPKASGGTQAETIIYGGPLTSRAVLNQVDLRSFQDTLQINDQAYVSDCYIEGDIDFMWGTGPVFFENVTCKMLTSNDSYVETRNPASHHGFIYYHCNFDAATGVSNAYLAQSVGVCEVVTIDCVMGDWIRPIGWRINAATGGARGRAGSAPAGGAGAPPAAAPGVRYYEFNSHYADGKPIDMSQRAPQSRELKAPADAQMIADYSNPTWVLGNNWIPMTRRPTTVTVKPAAPMSFSATFGFATDATCQWQKNGTPIPGANTTILEIKNATPADDGVYTLTIKTAAAAQTSAPATIKVE